MLNPYVSGEITSLMDALGAYKCGEAAGPLAHSEADESESIAYLARQEELWRKAAESPLAVGEAASVKRYLPKVQARLKAKIEA